ncbi:hypothetical protein ABIC12_001434 [Pantoea agglomerans]
MKNWVLFALFLTGCTPSTTFHRLDQIVTTTSPPSSCKVITRPLERIVNNTDKNINTNLKCSINHDNIYNIEKSDTLNLFFNENSYLGFTTSLALDPIYLAILNQNLDKIKTDNPKESETLQKKLKEIIIASVPFLLFLWGLISFRLSESRAKVGLLTPLLEKASDAIKSANENFKSNGIVTLDDINKFTIPMIGIKNLLEDHSLTDYLLEQNDDAFRYIKGLMPSNVVMEMRNKELFDKFRASMFLTASNLQQANSAINLINSDYKIISENIFTKNRPYFLIKKIGAYALYIFTLLGGFIVYLSLVAFF